MNEIKKLSELSDEQVNQALDVFVEGFYNIFSSITKDKEKLHRLFKSSFYYDMTYACLLDGTAVGFLGLADHNKRSLKLNRDIFFEILGGFAGKISYNAVRGALEKLNITDPNGIYIDFIATDPNHRSKGIGKKLIEFVRNLPNYKYIELEVFTKNPKAIKFYVREGFRAVGKKLDLLMVIQGAGRRIIMRLDK